VNVFVPTAKDWKAAFGARNVSARSDKECEIGTRVLRRMQAGCREKLACNSRQSRRVRTKLKQITGHAERNRVHSFRAAMTLNHARFPLLAGSEYLERFLHKLMPIRNDKGMTTG